MTTVVPAIDTFVNVNMGSMERPDYLVRVAEDYFKRSDAIFRDYSPAELLEQMDAAGVEKASSPGTGAWLPSTKAGCRLNGCSMISSIWTPIHRNAENE